MTGSDIVGLVIAVVLLANLAIALIRPERF